MCAFSRTSCGKRQSGDTMLLWLSVLLASLSWLFAVHLYVSENPLIRWVLLGFALATATAALRSDKRVSPLSPWHLLTFLLALIVTLIASPPYRAPLLVLSGAGILPLILARFAGRPFEFLGRAGLFVGALLVLQSPVYWLVCAWTARNPDLPAVGPALGWLLRFAGGDAAFFDHYFTVRSMQALHLVPGTYTLIGFFPLFLIAIGSAFTVWHFSGRERILPGLSRLGLILIGYLFLRCLIITGWFITAMLFVEYESKVVHVEIFWLPWITTLTFLPLWFFLGRFIPLYTDRPRPQGREPFIPSVLRLLGAALVCAGIVLAFRFPDPGAPKQGRVLIDEFHSMWERTDKPYDTDWYGPESEYNYYCMAQFLKYYFNVSINNKGPLTADKLAECDILLLKNPTKLYTPEEIRDIEKFVRSGGGLFLVGEHTDVFGTSSCLNQVARRFGILFRPDAVFDIERKWEQVYFPPKLGSHSIMNGIPFFRFAVSCSIETTTWRARPVMRGTGLWNLPIEYASNNFYPQVEDATYARSGAFDQAVAVSVGRGRVVAFADSTLYSNFLAFYPGKPEFLLRALDWLNRESVPSWLVPGGLDLALLGILVLLLVGLDRGPAPRYGAWALLCASVAAWGALFAASGAQDRYYPMPQPRTEVPWITFDLGTSDIELPVFGFTQKHEKSYQIFYQWVLRVGCYPRIAFTLKEALGKGAPIIIANPVKKFPPEAVEEINDFLSKGGALLILDSPANKQSTANEVLRRFGMAFGKEACRGSWLVEPTENARICRLRRALPLRGGEVLLRTEAGEPVVAARRIGDGLLVAAGTANRFFDTNFGFTSRSIPNPEMRAAYQFAFTLFEALRDREAAEKFKELGRLLAP